ncbi:MAG: DUF2304 domain-containing protein [Deltaproteobacteria bacterium]|nr:DUF2304 domain-containing protein [Deltaproteobacteria bacterium]
MIARIVFLAALVAIGYLGFVRRNRLPVNIMLLFVVLGLAAVAVIFPEEMDPIAQYMGVTAGVDMIVYLVQVGLLFVSLHFYTKFVDHQRQIAVLVREMAILKAELDQSRRGTASPPPVLQPHADQRARDAAE